MDTYLKYSSSQYNSVKDDTRSEAVETAEDFLPCPRLSSLGDGNNRNTSYEWNSTKKTLKQYPTINGDQWGPINNERCI